MSVTHSALNQRHSQASLLAEVGPDELTTAGTGSDDHAVVCPAGSHGAIHVAYLINHYPKVSHSFIRREILALERRGIEVDRIAVRGWDADVVDPEDLDERTRTRYLLEGGVPSLLLDALRTVIGRPRPFLQALAMTWQRSRRSDRGLHYHLLYLAQACRLAGWLRGTDVSHLHAHFGTNSSEIALLVRVLGGPSFSFTAHGTDEMDRGHRLGLDVKVEHAAFAVAVSAFTRSQLFRHVKVADWPKIEIVHCGLEPSFYEDQPTLPPSRNKFVCVGRLSEEKGHLILVEALAKVVDAGQDCSLVIVGDGDLRPQIESRAKALGIADRVSITGWVPSPRVRDEIRSARALVLPSFLEGLPVVVMEAMSLRRLVIASGVAGVPELVRHGETGWVVPPGSPTDLAEALLACLEASDVTFGKMAEAGYRRVTERHAIDREVSKLARLFTQLHPHARIAEWTSG